MLSVLLGLSMSLHLMAYQATQQSFQQTLQATDYGKRAVTVQWSWQGKSEQQAMAGTIRLLASARS